MVTGIGEVLAGLTDWFRLNPWLRWIAVTGILMLIGHDIPDLTGLKAAALAVVTTDTSRPGPSAAVLSEAFARADELPDILVAAIGSTAVNSVLATVQHLHRWLGSRRASR